MLNFNKNTIFTRGKSTEDVVDDTASGGVLAVWGAPGSGKTVTATKIAKHLSDKKKNVILLLCDTAAPMMSCVIPNSEFEVEKSLGSILAATHVTESLVKYNMVSLKKNPYMTVIGMLKGENEYTYAPYSKTQAEELIECLREIAPFVIIDCSSYIANDILSAVALMQSDEVLQMVNCDLKSISYLSSQLPLLKNSGFEPEEHYKAAGNIKPNHGAEKMAGSLGSLAFKIPYSAEVEEQYLAGNLLADLSMKNSRPFRDEIKKICKEVFNVR